MKTFSAKPAEIEKDWIVVDAKGAVVGRLAAFVASRLRGKHRPDYTPHVDCGDNVVIVNADQLVLTGKKAEKKVYPYYTGWRGGLKERTFKDLMERDPARVIQYAVRRMLPKSKLGKNMLTKLKIHRGSEHPHSAQQPQPLDLTKI